MNTFGLRRKLSAFGLGNILDAWNEYVSFILIIKKNIQFYMER